VQATKRTRAATAFVALALSAIAFAIPLGSEAQAAPAPRFGENSLLPPLSPGRGRDVPGLAVDPADPNHIVEAEADPVNEQCDYSVSFDGGRTWKGGHLTIRDSGENPPFPSPACSQNFDAGGYAHFNTGIVFGSGQNVYITFSAHRGAFNRLDTVPPTEGGAGDDSVVARSTDGGRTFQPAVVAIPGSSNPQPVSIRPQIAVQRGAGSGGEDRLYANAWQIHVNSNALGLRRMLVARSDDGGGTWTAPVVASAQNVRNAVAAAAEGTPDEVVRELSQPVVGPDGAVYAAYRNADRAIGTTCPPNPVIQTNCIVVAKSTDLGQSWTRKNTGVPFSGSAGQPRMAIDPATPAGIGTLYVAYFRPVGSDPGDITLQRSTDGGQTWSSPVRVNDDPAGSVQSFPQVSVGPGGRVNVIWFDRRHPYPGGGPRLGDIYYARSDDGGATFSPNRRMTDRTFNRDVGIDAALGSYSFYGPVSQPSSDGGVLGAWMDSRGGNLDNGFQDIYVSRLDPVASIGSSRIATATPPGLSVMLSRLAYPGGAEAAGASTPVTKVVVANEGDVAGALAGAVLARANWGPLLLSPVDRLPAAVKADATRMRPEGGFVIGDASSLSPAVENDLRESTRRGQNVSRVAAPSSVAPDDRPAEIARQIAELMRPLPGASPEAVIANPKTPEAAAASALAAALKLPILFVDERPTLPPPTTQAIVSLGVRRALIVGGPGSVNSAVESSLTTMLGPGNVKRVGGADQYETSEAVLKEAKTRGLPANVVYVADGARPIDGALLGAAVGRLTGLMLLTPSADTATAETRLAAIGVEATVDRLVAAVGTGGTDPDPPPPGQPPATGSAAPEGASGSGPGGSGTPRPGLSPSCGDKTQPRSSVSKRSTVTRKRIELKGRTTDRECSAEGRIVPTRRRLARVEVSVATRSARQCRFLLTSGRLSGRRSCAKPAFVRGRVVSFNRRSGKSAWQLSKGVLLRPGTYTAIARGVDRDGDVEVAKRRSNRATFRVR